MLLLAANFKRNMDKLDILYLVVVVVLTVVATWAVEPCGTQLQQPVSDSTTFVSSSLQLHEVCWNILIIIQ